MQNEVCFVLRELGRLVDLLPQTDPRSADYQMLLRSIECLDAMGQTINEIEDKLIAVSESAREPEKKPEVELSGKVISLGDASGVTVAPFTAPDFPEALTVDPETDFAEAPKAEEAKAEEAKTYDPSDVRKALVDARAKGVNVKAILAKVGADNFTAVPASRYAEIMKELEVVG